jgi:Na+-driven multidrug efflux pump
MVATVAQGILQVPIAIVLVYGWGPIPALGVFGAAIAMVSMTVLKVLIMIIQTFGIFRIARWETPGPLSEWKSVLGPLVVLAAPMGLTAGFWSTGNFLYNVIVQQLGDAALAASQIVGNLEGIFFVGSLGLMNAVNALVGRAVGAAQGTLARAWVVYIKRIGIFTGILFGFLFAVSSLGLSTMFPNVPALVITYSIVGVLINAVVQPVKVRNALMGASVLPSGNDVRGVMMGDFAAPFIIGLPLSLLLGLGTPLGIYGVFIARALEELGKLAIFTWRGRRLDWDIVAQKHNMLKPLGEDPFEGVIQA